MEFDQQTNPLYDLDLRFPPLSRTVAEVSEILTAGGVPDTDRLIEIVHHDPLVVASVLKRINSAYYGMRRRFDDLRKAVVMIGFIEVSNIVLATGYIGLRRLGITKNESSLIDRTMRASVGTGFFTNLLAQELVLPQRSTAFTVGLLHSIGRLVLLYNHPEDYMHIYEQSGDSYLPEPAREREFLGIDHMTIGALATRHWNFPDLIPTLIETYETPGHLGNPEQRRLGMAINASVDISTQLIPALPQHTEWKEGSELTDELLESAPFPLPLNFPPALSYLARDVNYPEKKLKELILSKQEEGLKYIEHVIKY